MLSLRQQKDPLKQISLFSVQFDIFSQDFERLLCPPQFALIIANIIISAVFAGHFVQNYYTILKILKFL